MRSKFILGILVAVSLSSCDKLKSISTNKTGQEELTDDEIVDSKVDIYNQSPEASIKALNGLIRKDNNGVITYIDKNSPKFENKDCFYPYIKSDENGLNLYLKVQHVDVEPLEINTYVVTVDKVDHTIKGPVNKKRINGKKKYYVETLDKIINTEEDLYTFEAIAEGEYVKTLFVGENRFVKKNLSEKTRKAFYNVLTAFIYLKK